jgi:hypothetical protein
MSHFTKQYLKENIEIINTLNNIQTLVSKRITAHTEGICSVILHLLVSHPILKVNATKRESIK